MKAFPARTGRECLHDKAAMVWNKQDRSQSPPVFCPASLT